MSLTSTIGLVAQVGTLISSIVGNFQQAHQETSLNAIEHEVRYSQIHLLSMLENMNLHLPNLTSISEYLWQKQSAWLGVISGTLDDILAQTVRMTDVMGGGTLAQGLPLGAGGGPVSIVFNVTVRSEADIDSMMSKMKSAMGMGVQT